MAPVSLLTSFSVFEPVNTASECLMQKRQHPENIVFSGVFSQKVTTLISYQNQRCWVERNAFFDTMLPAVTLDKRVTAGIYGNMSSMLCRSSRSFLVARSLREVMQIHCPNA